MDEHPPYLLIVLCLLVVHSLVAQVNLDSGMVGYYPFDNSVGDSSVLAPLNHGTNSGSAFDCGVFDTSIVFDGVNDYVKLDTNFRIDTTFSISVWIKPDITHAGTVFSMRRQCTSSSRGWNKFYMSLTGFNQGVYYNNQPGITVTNQLALSLYRCHLNCYGWSNRFIYTIPGVQIDTNCFTHIVVTVDSNYSNANRNYRIYVNGQYYPDTLSWIPNSNNLANTVDPFNTSINNNYFSYFGIGHDNFNQSSHQAPFDGSLDEARLYRHVLSPATVAALYQQGFNIQPPPVLVFNDSAYCPGETDTVSMLGADSCDYFYCTLNDSVIGSGTSVSVPHPDQVPDTLELIYNLNGLCLLDTVQQIFNPNPAMTTNVQDSICQGDSLFAGGAWQTAPGTYADTLSGMNGCDSIVTTTLLVLPIDSSWTTFQLCQGDSVWINGAYVSQPGFYNDTLTNSFGCDSVSHINLTVDFAFFDTTLASICPGSSYSFMGNSYSQPGTYLDTTTGTPCDTLNVLMLSVYPTDSTALSVSICSGDSLFAGGAYQSQAGSYTDTFQNTLGCDSIVYTSLALFYAYDTTVAAVCTGESYNFLGQPFSQAGTYLDTVSGQGCDTVKLLSLTVWPVDSTAAFLQICQGASVFLGGAFQTQPGTYVDTFQNAYGCDSVVHTSLSTFLVTDTSSVAICAGDSFPAGGGIQYNPGTYVDTLAAPGGCDSVHVTYLSVEWQHDTIHYSICQGDSLFLLGTWRSTPGTFLDTVAGQPCFEVRHHVLQAWPNHQSNTTLSVCHGDSAFLAGAWRTTPGLYVDSFSTQHGCDSVVTSSLYFYYEFLHLTPKLCRDQPYPETGIIYSSDTTFEDTVFNGSCEVIRTHEISITDFFRDSVHLEVCPGDSVFLAGAWQDQSGAFVDTLPTNTCDRIRTTFLTVSGYEVEWTGVEMCKGDSMLLNGSYRKREGVYYDTLSPGSNPDSCKKVLAYDLRFSGRELQLPEISIADSGFCPNRSFTLSAGVPKPGIYWHNGHTSETISFSDSGWASVAYTHCGHVLRDSMYIVVPECWCSYYFPNTFTPTGNGLNDVFRPLHDCHFHHFELTVYNRWGEMIFRTNDDKAGWDGKVQGEEAPRGVYGIRFVYTVSPTQPKQIEYRSITLLR